MAYEGGKATRGYERRRREKDGQAIANRRGRMCGRMFRRRGVKEIKECRCASIMNIERRMGGVSRAPLAPEPPTTSHLTRTLLRPPVKAPDSTRRNSDGPTRRSPRGPRPSAPRPSPRDASPPCLGRASPTPAVRPKTPTAPSFRCLGWTGKGGD